MDKDNHLTWEANDAIPTALALVTVICLVMQGVRLLTVADLLQSPTKRVLHGFGDGAGTTCKRALSASACASSVSLYAT